MNRAKFMVAALLLVGACAPQKTETRSEPAQQVEAPQGPTVTSDQNDAIDSLFRRKAPELQSCWQDEYQRTQNRKIEGDVTLSMTVTKAGHATDVRVIKSTINAPNIDACVVKAIGEWVFPEGPADAPYRRTVHLGAEF
jgi:TonB family protein